MEKFMFFKKKERVPKPVYEDVSELFDELAEKMVIIENATKSLDPKLTNEYTGRARNLKIILNGLNGYNNSEPEYVSLYHLVPPWNYERTVFKNGVPKELVRDVVHKIIIGVYTINGGKMIKHNIEDVYTEFKQLEKKFPEALKLLLEIK